MGDARAKHGVNSELADRAERLSDREREHACRPHAAVAVALEPAALDQVGEALPAAAVDLDPAPGTAGSSAAGFFAAIIHVSTTFPEASRMLGEPNHPHGYATKGAEDGEAAGGLM